jgi:hypothetical protein
MQISTVSTLSGWKWHLSKEGSDKTLCGRAISSGTSRTGEGCKLCVKAEAKLTDARSRLEYATRAAETQDEVMSQAEPVKPSKMERITRRTGITVPDAPQCAAHKTSGWDEDGRACVVLPNGVHTYLSIVQWGNTERTGDGVAVFFPYAREARGDRTSEVIFWANGGELTMDMLARAYAGERVEFDAEPVQTPAPVKGNVVDTPSGPGVVVDVDTYGGEVLVRLYEGGEFDTEHGRWFPVADMSVTGHDADAMVFAAGGSMRPAGGDTAPVLAHALPTEVLISEIVRAGGIRRRTPEEMERAAQNEAARAKLRATARALRG